MPETFLTFDFGANEETAQQARHKLEVWKQAFRLDKRLLFKFDRGEATTEKAPEEPKGKPGQGEKATGDGGPVKLLVRLYFSDHEKLTQQRWIDRIPAEEPFKTAAPRVVPQRDASFAATQERFGALE